MGRVKLKIKRLESVNNRQVTYSKRRHGILKKAKELSILCDVDIVLLMFSPTGKATFFHGDRSNVEEVIEKFAQLTPQERAKRKLESLEALKKTFKKLDHDVNVQEFLGGSTQTVEDMSNQVRFLQDQHSEVQKRLSYWRNPEKIDSIEDLMQMEESLRESIDHLHQHKENLGQHEFMSLSNLESTNQLENGMHLHFGMPGMQEAQPISCLQINENQHLLFQNDPTFLSHGAIGSSLDESLPGCSSYFGGVKQEISNLGQQVDNLVQEGCVLDDLNGNSAYLSLHVGDRYPFPPFGSLSLPDHQRKVVTHDMEMEMNLHGHHLDYQVVNGNIENPAMTTLYDHNMHHHHNWAAPPAPCDIAVFDGSSYNQQAN